MSEIREIVTKAIVAKGKKSLYLTEEIETDLNPYSILGCWIINHEFEAYKENDVVYITGSFEANIWYSLKNNTKTDVLRSKIEYKKDCKVKQLVKDYLENSDDVLVKILKNPQATNAKIKDNKIILDITFDILAEIIGETKMQVTVFSEDKEALDVEDLDIEVNEDFLTKK